MIDGGILMPSLVAHDDVHVLNGDILMKVIFCLYCIWVHRYDSSIQLIWEHAHHHLECSWTNNILMHSVCTNLQECVGDYVHQLVEIYVHLQSNLVLVFASMSVPMGGIACMCIMTSMLLKNLACDWWHFSPCLLHANYWVGSITCMGAISSVCGCCAFCCTCSCYNSSRMCSSCSSFSCCFSTCNSFSVSLHAFMWSSCHAITL